MPDTRIAATGKRVLLITADSWDMTVLGDIIAAEGHRVLEADNGLRGIDRARQRQPDLIVLNIEMPGMSPLDVVETLRSDADTRDIPIVVITPSARECHEVIGTGTYFYMTKSDAAAAFGDLIRMLTTP